jgi:hypothetical protein
MLRILCCRFNRWLILSILPDPDTRFLSTKWGLSVRRVIRRTERAAWHLEVIAKDPSLRSG